MMTEDLRNTAKALRVFAELPRVADQLDDAADKIERMTAERVMAIAMAKSLCRGEDWCSDWPDDLHMADVIEKRIYNMALDWRNDDAGNETTPDPKRATPNRQTPAAP